MVNKSKIIILSIFIFSLTFSLSFTVFPKNSLACHLGGPYDYYQTCNPGIPCIYNSQCGSGKISAYDFEIDWGGCTMGFAAGQYYSASCVFFSIPLCVCSGPDAKWYTSPSYDGQVCKRRSGWFCERDIKEGKWDSSDSKCVVCNGKREASYFDCSGDYDGDYKCESACGADPRCDEKYPNIMYDTDGDLFYDLYCDSNCNAYKCNPSTECSSLALGGITYKCSYNYYYSSSSPRYDWLIGPFEGYPWQSCFDNHDNDCDGLVDCADPDCARVKNPNTGVICCQSDSDCPAYNPSTHLKMYCDTTTHTCKTKPSCVDNTECEGGWCCDKLVGGTGNCKQKGTITSYGGRSYICDPPEGFVNSSNEEINTNNQASKKLTLLDLLINPFSYFFKK